jgi:photosynthetic reaction center cytochrome c subunit
MMLGSKRTIQGATVVLGAWLVCVALARAQSATQERPPLAEEVFKNVRVLRGIPVDEFMGTMGIFSAALGFSCEDCHTGSDTGWDAYALDTSPKKATARRMIQMMGAINQGSFGGRQVVTCYSCHRGSNRPKVTPSLARLYGADNPEEPDDVVTAARGAPPTDQIFDKYLQALGGPQKLAGLTSFVAKGKSQGYGPEGYDRAVEIFAKAPSQRTTIIHTLDGDSTAVYDGKAAWIAGPHRPVPILTLSGSDLDGARLDAELSFPSRIKQSLTGWRVGVPTTIEDRDVQVVQGTGAGSVLATLYFDQESGLLVRQVRFVGSRVGRLPTQVDYSDYREVAGVKMPFRWTVTWLDGRDSFELSEVQPNVPIDAARFGKPEK